MTRLFPLAERALGILARAALGYVSILGVLTLGNIPRADAISGALWMTLAGMAMLGLHTLWERHQGQDQEAS